jgi:hypothetical protein
MGVSRREFTRILGAGVGATLMPGSAFAGAVGTVAGHPNLLVVCSDQHSGRMLEGGFGEDSRVRTPNLSRLARRGVCFRHAYCGSPVCAPSRASLMTGRFASDVGSYGNTTTFDGSVPTWGTHLRDVGYTWRRMVEKHSADELFDILRGRLGDGQGALLTQKEHAQWKPKVT